MMFGRLDEFTRAHTRPGVFCPRAKFMGDSVPFHGHAYYAGFISGERLLEVLMHPYIKMCKAVNQTVVPEEAAPCVKTLFDHQQRMRDSLLSVWNDAVYRVLQG